MRKTFLILGLLLALAGCSTTAAPNDGRIPSLRSNYAERVHCDDFDWGGNEEGKGSGHVECRIGQDIIKVYCDEGFRTRTNDHNDQDVICSHDGQTNVFYRGADRSPAKEEQWSLRRYDHFRAVMPGKDWEHLPILDCVWNPTAINYAESAYCYPA